MPKELKDQKGRRVHPYIPELCQSFRRGDIDRREFLRTATLLGVSAAAAYGFAGRITGEAAVPKAVAAETPKKGGRLRCAMRASSEGEAELLLWEVESLLCCGPAAGGGYRGHITPSVMTYSTFVDRTDVHPALEVFVA